MLRDQCISHTMIFFVRLLRPRLVRISTVLFCLFQITSLRAQDQTSPLGAQQRVRTAAGQLEIQSFRNPQAFFRLGPFEEVLIASAGVGYTDNSNLTPTNK